jgi:MoxR-like ATPase
MPNFDQYNLESLGGKKLNNIRFSEEVEKEAELHADKLEGQEADKVAELAFLTRTEIFEMLHAEMNKTGSPTIGPELATASAATAETALPGKKAQYEQAFQTLLQKKGFQLKLAYYKKLLAKANATLQEGLKRHAREQHELNGNYLGYKKLLAEQSKLEKQLEEVMSELFAERGHDPDSMLVETRQLLEEGLADVKGSLEKLKKANPDTAAFLEYEKIKKYSQELENGFAWTGSRKWIVDEALKRAMASRPLIVLMGESGTGKTALARALSQKLTGMEPEREVGGKDYRLRDLLGARAIDEKGDYLKFGPLLRAMTGEESSRDKTPKNEGGIYFDDEFNTRPVEVQRQILKFVAEAKPGQKVTVPGTELKVTVQPKFLYLAAGNPNSARYDREETPVEAYREFSGVLNVDFMDQNEDYPELMEVMVAALLDQKTRRMRVVSKEEVMPNFTIDESGKFDVDLLAGNGGFLWRFACAWKSLLQAFSHQENILHQLNPGQPKEKYYLQKFVLDLGKVRDWLYQYKISKYDRQFGLEIFIVEKLLEELKSYPQEDRDLVRKILDVFKIDQEELDNREKPFTTMTPKEIGYLFPNVPRLPGEALKMPIDIPEPETIELDEEGNERPNPQPAPPKHPRDIVGFKNHIAKLPLTLPQKEKLNVMMEGYDEAVATAREIDPKVQIKPIQEVIAAFLKLGPAKLKEIAEFGKPTLLVTPKNSFLEKKAALDANRKYENQEGTYVGGSSFQSVATPTKTVISIVDGQPHILHISGIDPNSRFDERKKAFKAHFARKGMRLINAHEAAVLEQLSLRDYKRNGNDVGKIVDYYQGNDNDTISCLDDEYLTDSSRVAYSYFNAGNRGVLFNAAGPGDADERLRGRPSVQVLEY